MKDRKVVLKKEKKAAIKNKIKSTIISSFVVQSSPQFFLLFPFSPDYSFTYQNFQINNKVFCIVLQLFVLLFLEPFF